MTKKAKESRKFVVNAMLRISNDIEFLAYVEDQIFMLGGIIKQRDPQLFEEIIRSLDSGLRQSRELELKRALKNLN